MFGINEARRRKALAEESVFDYVDKESDRIKKQSEAERLGANQTIKPKVTIRQRFQRTRPAYASTLNAVIGFRPNKTKKLKSTATKGIYRSPFRR